MSKQISSIIAIVLVILVAIFSILNIKEVDINFLVSQVRVPLVLIILISVAVGAIINFAFGFSKNLKNNRDIKKLKKQIEAMSKENNDLKNDIAQLKLDNVEQIEEVKEELSTQQPTEQKA